VTTPYLIDLTEQLQRIKHELREELLSDLHTHADRTAWPAHMNIDTCARYLDTTPHRIRKLVARSAIPFSQEGAGCRLSFARRDLDDWMARFRRDVSGD
jgi:hypothetical protein